MSAQRTLIAVVGPGDAATARDIADAAAVGRELASAGCVVVTGGRHSGVMHAAASGASAAGGITVGILPSADRGEASPAIAIALPTGLGEARNAVVALSGAAMVVCGMSPGTASEVALAVQRGRPVVLVRPDEAVESFIRSLRGPGRILIAADAAQVVPLLRPLLNIPDVTAASPAAAIPHHRNVP